MRLLGLDCCKLECNRKERVYAFLLVASQGLINVFGDTRSGAGQGEEVGQVIIDLVPEKTGVDRVTQGAQLLTVLWENGVGVTQSLEWCLGTIVAASNSGWLAILGNELFLDQVHNRLEEIVVDTHVVVELVEGYDLAYRVETIVP